MSKGRRGGDTASAPTTSTGMGFTLFDKSYGLCSMHDVRPYVVEIR